jgi:hypothetical protein
LRASMSFFLHLRNFRKTQDKKLITLYEKNKDAIFLKACRVKGQHNPQDLPLTDWGDYESYIRQILNNEQNVLTKDKVLILEPTSGTTSHTKYIPYTRGLRKEFKRAIQPWLLGLYLSKPSLFFRNQYWSISPPSNTVDDKKHAIPVGFEQDSQYLGGNLSRVMDRIMTVPSQLRNISAYEDWARITIFFLVRDKNLGLISVWHPSFLTILLEKIKTSYYEIVSDIENGSISISTEEAARVLMGLKLKANTRRARELRSADPSKNNFFLHIWPRLQVISCWADDPEETSLLELRKIFPSVWIQPKGIVATEGIVSFPFGKISGLPAYRSHVLEFIDVRNDDIKSIDGLELHGEYEPVISTGGGLYRYRMNDVVKVTGFYRKKIPLLKFLYKRDYVSDIRGEKVSLQQVMVIVNQVKVLWTGIRFFMLSPVVKGNKAFYCCYIYPDDAATMLPDQLCGLIDESLRKNFHYNYARQLGQLAKPQVFLLEKDPVEDIINYLESTGMRRGDIKLLPLSRLGIWVEVLRGRWADHGQ